MASQIATGKGWRESRARGPCPRESGSKWSGGQLCTLVYTHVLESTEKPASKTLCLGRSEGKQRRFLLITFCSNPHNEILEISHPSLTYSEAQVRRREALGHSPALLGLWGGQGACCIPSLPRPLSRGLFYRCSQLCHLPCCVFLNPKPTDRQSPEPARLSLRHWAANQSLFSLYGHFTDD